MVTRHRAPLTGLPSDLQGTRLVHLSDFHRGHGDTDPDIQAAIEVARGLEPDYLVITGDFVEKAPGDIPYILDRLADVTARQGRYAVLGNHDYEGDVPALCRGLESLGFEVLRNRAHQAQPGLWFAGVDDNRYGNTDLAGALAGVPTGAALLLLCHNPELLQQVERPLLMLSGHTHGAQIRVPFPWPQLVCRWHLGTRYVHGWYHRGPARLYVNRGVGVTGPWPFNRRFRCPPEVALFELVCP